MSDQTLAQISYFALWIIEGILDLLIIGCFGVILFKITGHLIKVGHGRATLRVFSEPRSFLRYKLPQAFGRYCRLRDGWKRDAYYLSQIGVMSLFLLLGMSVVSSQRPEFGRLIIAFVGLCLMFYGMRWFTDSHDSSITFYETSIQNRPKRGTTSYSSYQRAILDQVNFEGNCFNVLTLISKRDRWFYDEEYGFNSNDDLQPLITLLSKAGLPIEDRRKLS